MFPNLNLRYPLRGNEIPCASSLIFRLTSQFSSKLYKFRKIWFVGFGNYWHLKNKTEITSYPMASQYHNALTPPPSIFKNIWFGSYLTIGNCTSAFFSLDSYFYAASTTSSPREFILIYVYFWNSMLIIVFSTIKICI